VDVEDQYLIQLLRETFARDEGELGVGVEVLRRAVFLTGTVGSEERRSRLEAVARGVCSAYLVVNEIRVRPPAAAGSPEPLP
jgi:osmotically-inducible protein OsmY